MATVSVEYCGMHGMGQTVTAARQEAARKAEKALTGDYNPWVVTYRGLTVLVHRCPHGWSDSVIADEKGTRVGIIYGGGNHATRNDAIQAAQNNLAQLGWQPEDGLVSPMLTNRADMGEFKTWAEFQLRYREAIAKGMNDNDAHSYAGRNPARPELWQS